MPVWSALNADRTNTNKSFFRCSVRLYQTGKVENQNETKSFCFEIETLSQSIIISFSNSQRAKSTLPLCAR
jgi:hypothetical protein